MVHCTGCQLYEQKAITWFIKSIEDHLEKARSKWEAGDSSGGACSFSMSVAKLGSLMAVPTEPPYCLVYPTIYAASVPPKDRNHFNVQGGPPGLHTHVCICCTLLQHANLSEAHGQKYHGSHLVILWGVQYSHLLPEITMPHNHWAPLIDLHTGKPLPMVPVGDFQLVDKIFPGMPRDSLLYNSDDLTKLQRMRFQVATHRMEELPTLNPRGRSLNPPAPQGRCTAQPARMENLPNPEGNLSRPPHQRHLQTLQAESLHTTTNAPLHRKNAMAPVTKTPTVTGEARTRRVASPHGNMQHPHYRCCPPPHRQRRSPA